MKVKVNTGGGMRGLLKYQVKKDSIFICGSQQNQHDFLRETAALRSLRPDCKKPVLHFSLSQPPNENLKNQIWEEVAEKFLEKMGLENNSFFCVRHTDKNHDHIHIAVNKISRDGSLWDTQKSALRGIKVCEEIEKELNLTITKTLASHREITSEKSISSGAIQQLARTGRLTAKTESRIQKKIRERIKNERSGKNREALQGTNFSDGRLDCSPPSNFKEDEGSRKQIIKTGNSKQEALHDQKVVFITEDDEGGWLQSPARVADRYPPNLRGRLSNKSSPKIANAFDLFWKNRDKPTFRWHHDSQQIQLIAKPTQQNVNAIFDLAREQQLTEPLEIFGSPDFQKLAVEEAHRRGIKVKADDLDAKIRLKKLEEQAAHRQEAERAATEKIRIEEALKIEENQTATKNYPTFKM